MPLNPNPSLLSPSQISKRTFDSTNDALRISLAESTGISIELSATDGDTIATVAVAADPGTGTQTVGMVANTVIVAEQSCVGYKQIVLYSQAAAGTTVAGSAKVQVSPSDAGTDFVDLGLSLTSSTASAMTLTSVTSIVARRIRVVSVTAPTGGSVTYKLLQQG